MKKPISPMLCSKGFSLAEVVVAMGIMSLVALGYMQLQAQKAQQNRTERVNNQINQFVSDIRGFLHREGYCQKSFEGERIYEGRKTSISSIKTPIGHERYRVDEPYGEGSFIISEIFMEDFELEHQENNTGLATLVFTLERLGNVYGAQSIQHRFEMIVYRDTQNRIINCNPISAYTADTNVSSKNRPFGINPADIQKIADQENVNVQLSEKDIQKALRSNPHLQKMKKALENVQEMNRRLEESFNEDF